MIQGNELTLLREAPRVSEQQHPAEIFWSQVNKEDTKFAKTLKTWINLKNRDRKDKLKNFIYWEKG
jgi:hypothetical protein